jgi:hypothetical protein
MKAIHGGKTKTDKIDAAKIAGLLRGGLFPQAYVYSSAKRTPPYSEGVTLQSAFLTPKALYSRAFS